MTFFGPANNERSSMKKTIYIGSDDFTKIIDNDHFYLDKTLLVKELIDKPSEVILFTRPRRFGKTLNMMMLKTFFENIPGTARYFQDLSIWQCGDAYRAYQGKYPVIFLTFKDAKCDSWEDTYESICRLLQKEFNRHELLGHFDTLNSYQKKQIHKILDETASPVVYKDALGDLTEYLHQATGVRPIILIDEYDTPIMQGREKGFQQEIISFIRNLFSGGMKNNMHLERAILTGILRIAQEDIFSGLNNIKVQSLLDCDYSSCFGFTLEEIHNIVQYYGVSDKMEEIRDWYDGYLFGGQEIYNPWSVMNYFAAGCKPGTFWNATSSNDIIKRLLRSPSPQVITSLTALLNGETLDEYIEKDIAYGMADDNILFSLLLMSGYLSEKDDHKLGIPNREIAEVYRKEIFEQLADYPAGTSQYKFLEAVLSEKPEQIQTQLRGFLLANTSFYDTASEGFYHALVLGMLSAIGGAYKIYSNRESGDGRYDLQLVNFRESKGILFEFKILKNVAGTEDSIMTQLQHTAKEIALRQIEQKKYDMELKSQGIKKIVKYGIVFYKKYVAVVKG